MGGRKCSFKNCDRRPGVRMFRFPLKNRNICKLWIENSGKEDEFLQLTPTELHEKYVCQDHFEPRHFENRRYLSKDAIPRKYFEPTQKIESNWKTSCKKKRSISGSSICSFKDCNNRRPVVRMFRYPVNEKYRCELWLENSGRKDELSRFSPKALGEKYVCQDHFEVQQFLNKHRLSKDAIPRKYCESISQKVVTTDPLAIAVNEHDQNMELNIETKRKLKDNNTRSLKSLNPNKRIMNEKVEIQKKIIKQKNSCIARYKNRIKICKEQHNLNSLLEKSEYQSVVSRALVDMQFRSPTCREPWSPKQKEFALKLFNKSPATYKFLLEEENIVLPCESSIRKWIGESKLDSGIVNDIKKEKLESCDTSQYDTVLNCDVDVKDCALLGKTEK